MDLDDVQSLRGADPDGMWQRIVDLPAQLRDSWQLVSGFTLPADYADLDNVVILGMGGSAIGGDLARTLVAAEARVPIEVVRDYAIPAYVNHRTLVITSSYSGNTEETLAAFTLARVAGAKVVALTTGGEVFARCQEHGLPVFKFAYASQPRAALGYSLAPLLGVLRKAGVVGDQAGAIAEAAAVLDAQRAVIGPDAPESRNQAKHLARAVHGRLPVVYGAGLTAEVARRWKGQFNENGKSYAAYDVLPELDHNTVVGYEFPATLPEALVAIFLQPKQLHPRVTVRFQATQELLGRRGIPFHIVKSEGEGALAQMLSALYVGDWTSYYLAMLNEVDPTPVKAIDFLKEQIAKA